MWQPPHWATEAKSSSVALELRRGDDVVKTISLAGRKSYVLGRQGDIVVEDAGASRQHAAIVHRDGAAYLFDLKSAKGVALRGAQLKPMEPAKLADGDAFVLGENPLRYVIRGLAPAGAPPPPPPPPAAPAWEPPAWAVVPAEPVRFRLQRGGETIQELQLDRKKAYVLGRNKQQCDVAVPHDSVSRQHAAVLHGAQGAGGGPSVHVVDFNSTKGTFVDQGAGWKRLPPNVPTLLPPGGSVRFGECSTVLQHLVAAPEPEAAPAPAEDANAPRFGAMIQSTVLTGAGVGSCVEAAAASAPAPAIYGNVIDAPAAAAAAEAGGEAAASAAEEDDDDEEEETGFSNSDFRNALAPFMQRRAEPSADGDGKKKKKKKKKKRGRADDSDDSDGEPAAPLVLEKEAAGAAGLILRKQKGAPEKKKKSSSSGGMKIKF